MKFSTALFLSSSAALTLASPAVPLENRQAGTTVIKACATQTATAAAVNPTLVVQGTAGCTGVAASGTNPTRNDIVNGICKPFTLIFARGTGEDPNLGNIVGPSFIDALNTAFGASNVAVQGVNNYPADVPGFCAGGSSTGSANLASLIQQTLTQCPKTKLCVSGYSQGAQVVHNAAKQISTAATNFINSVVLFGDPDNGQPVGKIPASKVSTDCRSGDNICAGGSQILLPHLSYCQDVAKEAAFVKSKAGKLST